MSNKLQLQKKPYYNNDDSAKAFIFSILVPYILSFVISTLVSLAIGANKELLESVSSSPVFLILLSLCGPLSFALIFFLYTKVAGVSFRACTITNKVKPADVFSSMFVALVSFAGLFMLICCHDQLLNLIGFKIESSVSGLPLDNAGWLVLYIILFALLPAVCEELLFRGLVLQGLRKNLADRSALLLSALMFALMHGNLQQLCYPFLLGLILGWIALRTGNIMSSMIVHFVNNALVVLYAYLQANYGFAFAAFQNVWWYYLLAFLLAGVTFALFYILDKFVFNHKNNSDVEKDIQKPSLFVWLGIGLAVIMLVVDTIIKFLS